MAYFEELNPIVMGIIGEYMLNNQRLCKLLYYYSDDKTPNYNPFLEPDIEDTSSDMSLRNDRVSRVWGNF